jgi:hypothetical protein
MKWRPLPARDCHHDIWPQSATTATTTLGGQVVEAVRSKISLLTISRDSITQTDDRKIMQYNIGTILAVIAIILVLATYLTGAPLVPVAVILLALAIIFGGNAFRQV